MKLYQGEGCTTVINVDSCLSSDSSKEMQVVLGGVEVRREEPDYDQVISVEKAILHNNYSTTPHGTASNDVGEVMRLH